MPIDYDALKSLARQISRPVRDLVALAPANDPFYAGCPHRERDARWFRDLWDRFGFEHGVHLRRIHYRLISSSEDARVLKPDSAPYENTDNDWKLLGRAGLAARYLDFVPAAAFVDRRNDEPQIFAPEPTTLDPTIDVDNDFAYIGCGEFPDLPSLSINHLEAEQDYVVECWIEKSTQNDWLVPLCRARQVNLVVGIGELSETACRNLVNRAVETGKPARILYLSDFDPGGRSMPAAVARKIEYPLRRYDLDTDITLQPIILTERQCADYRLPRTPIKDSERRKDKFEERFGVGATELDALEALHPGEMKRIVDGEISRYLDPTLDGRVQEVRWAFQDRLRRIGEQILGSRAEEIEDLRSEHEEIVDQLNEWGDRADQLWDEIARELAAEAPDLSDFEKPEPEPAQEPDGFLLFDSKRDYLTQLDHYHHWQRR